MRFAERAQLDSPYTYASKIAPAARFDLTSSAISPVTLNELPVELERLELSSKAPYGDPALLELVAARAGVPVECVVLTVGTSMANHLALTALFDAGDEVLIEEPAYDPLLYAAQLLGARIRRLPRREENGWAIDPDDLRRAITPRTRLIVLCNLHNPTSAGIAPEAMRAIGEAAATAGAHVLVDEVYREAVWGAEKQHAFSLADNMVVTSSLTKAFGLGGLRCGWILASPELAGRIRRLQDLFGGTNVSVAEQLSIAAFRSLPKLEARARRNLDTNRALAAERLASHPALQLAIPEHGTTLAPRLLRGRADDFGTLLRERYETAVVSGAHFEMPCHIRIGLGGDPGLFRQAVERIAEALEEFGTR